MVTVTATARTTLGFRPFRAASATHNGASTCRGRRLLVEFFAQWRHAWLRYLDSINPGIYRYDAIHERLFGQVS